MFSHAPARLAPWLVGVALAISGFVVEATATRAGILDASWTAPTTNTSARADLLRIISNAGSVWLDELSVREMAP